MARTVRNQIWLCREMGLQRVHEDCDVAKNICVALHGVIEAGGVDVCEEDTNLAELGTTYHEIDEPLERDGEAHGLPRGMQVYGEVLEVRESGEVAKRDRERI